MAKQRVHAEEHENVERWVTPYADMITLLLALFIIMYAMSAVNQGKFDQLAHSVRTQFGGPVALGVLDGGGSIITIGGGGILAGELAVNLERGLGLEALENVEILDRHETVTIRLRTDGPFFRPGSADLEPPLRRTLEEVAALLWRLPNPVRIEGHTCDLPLRGGRYASNWELSAQRALNVLTYLLQQQGLSAERLAAAAFADTRPAAPNTTEAQRKRNRRVDLVILGVDEQQRLDSLPELVGPGAVQLAPVADLPAGGLQPGSKAAP